MLLVSSIILGLSVAIPIGPISIEMIRQGLKNGFMHGWSVGLGGMTIDVLMIVIVYFSSGPLLISPILQQFMWLIGAIFLFYLGYCSIKEASYNFTNDNNVEKKSYLSSYRNGFLVAITPGNLVFWFSVFGTLLSDKIQNYDKLDFSIMAVGIILGILIHDILLMILVKYAKAFLNQQWIKRVSIIAGLILICFGGVFISKFFVLL
ncbi:LysE family translocator [Bacillus sp. JJ722]|uniref:LysE family translocator n=1 Tax=Bacillus sp. JJ722 TaxID=3122973 RepID=UPI002FFF94DC